MFKQISIFLCAVQILSDECKCQKFIDLPSDSDEPPDNTLSKPLRKYSKSGVEILSKESKRQKFIDLPYDMVRQRYIPENKLTKIETPSRRYLQDKSNYTMTPELLQNNIRRLKSMTGNSRRYFPRYKEFNTGKIIKKKVQTLLELNHVRIERTLLEIHDVVENYKKTGDFLVGYLTCILKTENKQLNDLYDYMIINDHLSISVSGKVVEEMMKSRERISRVFQEMVNKHNELTNNSFDISFSNMDYFNNEHDTDTPKTQYNMRPQIMKLPTVLPLLNLHTKRRPVHTKPQARKMYRSPALPLKNSKYQIAVARTVNPKTQQNSAVLLRRMVSLYRELPGSAMLA